MNLDLNYQFKPIYLCRILGRILINRNKMKQYNRIAIAIDNTEVDIQMLKAVNAMQRITDDVTEIHILHGRNLSYLESEFIKDHEDLKAANEGREATIKSNMEALIKEHLQLKENNKVQFDILPGSPVEGIIDLHKKNSFDLIVVGKKVKKKRSGRVAKELIRRADVPVLVIPEEIKEGFELNKIVVPYDYSKLSDLALTTALSLSDTAQIECLHVMDAPSTSAGMMASSEKLIEAMKASRKADFLERIEKLSLSRSVELKIQFNSNRLTANDIIAYTAHEGHDLIVMGTRGHTLFERFFMGSVTEKVVSENDHLALLIVE